MTLPRYIPNYVNFEPGRTPVIYSGPFWDGCEIDAAISALTTGKWITAGEQVARFENEFGRKFGTRFNQMVNSGSSANLVMLAALKRYLGWKDGDEIIVSAVSFPTTVAPIVQNGLKPVFADIEMDTLNFDLAEVAKKITEKTVAIFVSPVLGNPPDLDRLLSIVEDYGPIRILGDNCDSLGTRWSGKLWTDFCVSHSCSFYAAHHLCTGEGGMVSSNILELVDTARKFSRWGKACWCKGAANLLSCGTCGVRFSEWLGEDIGVIDHRYIFDVAGWNLTPLDLQGAIGVEQLKKVDDIETKRRSNARKIMDIFKGAKGVRTVEVLPNADPCWFAVPLVCETKEIKESLVSHFETNLIQTRTMFAGNLLRHPGYSHLGEAADYPNADQVLKKVLFLGCHPSFTDDIVAYIAQVFSQWRPPIFTLISG